MEAQHVVDILIGIVLAGLGWWMGTMHTSQKELLDRHNDLREKIPNEYVSKNDFQHSLEHIRTTLDNIWKAIRENK